MMEEGHGERRIKKNSERDRKRLISVVKEITVVLIAATSRKSSPTTTSNATKTINTIINGNAGLLDLF